MIDTHCHLTYQDFENNVASVIQDAHDAGVLKMISVATTLEDSQRIQRLADQFPNVYATVGIHPHYAPSIESQAVLNSAMPTLCQHNKVVALGEMGLDRHYDDPPFDLQEKVLNWQLELITSDALPEIPIIIHNREATKDTLSHLSASGITPDRFVFHCFTGEAWELDAILDFGAMISFTGIVTFGSAKEVADCARRVPLDRIMVETDSPYLTPAPNRKIRPNEPKYVMDVARFLAKDRDMDIRDFEKATDENARRFFNLPD